MGCSRGGCQQVPEQWSHLESGGFFGGVLSGGELMADL